MPNDTMTSTDKQSSRPPAPASSSSSGGGVQLKQVVGGAPYDVQLAALTPQREPAAPGARAVQASEKKAAPHTNEANGASGAVQRRALSRGDANVQQSADDETRPSTAMVQRTDASGMQVQLMVSDYSAPAGGSGPTSLLAVQFSGGPTGGGGGRPAPDVHTDVAAPPVGAGPGQVPQERVDAAEKNGVKWKEVTGGDGKVKGYVVVPAKGQEVNDRLTAMRPSTAERPALEGLARQAEVALGAAAAAGGLGAGQAMAAKVVTIVDEFVATMRAVEGAVESVDKIFGETLGAASPTVAGAVGQDSAVVRAAATSGNLRELMTVVFNFCFNFGKRYLDGSAAAAAKGKTAEFETYKATIAAKVEPLKKKDGSNMAQPLAERLGQERLVSEPRELMAKQNETRLANTDAPSQTSGRTGADLGGASALSKAEAVHQGGGADAKTITAEEVAATELQWKEGMRVWYINEASQWVQQARAANLPLGGGISGTTARLMEANQMLGATDPQAARSAIMGYLLPINAHTLIEILQGASTYVGGQPPMDFEVYTKVDPYNLRGIFANADFWAAVDETIARKNGALPAE